MAGWLAAASVGLAQSGQPSGPAAGKGHQTTSPYDATASTDWPAEPPVEVPYAVPVPRPSAPARTTAAPQPDLAAQGAASCTTCGPCGPCCPQGRIWGSAEYLLWWAKGMNVPPLVTESPAGSPRALAGVLGAPGTTVLFGGDAVDDRARSGLRLRAGVWLDECQTCGLEGSFLFLGREGEHETFTCADNTMTIARPFFNASLDPGSVLAAAPRPDSELVCLPGLLSGSVTVHTATEFFGFDVNFRKNLCCGCDYRIDGLLGYRYLQLTDHVTATEDLGVTSTTAPALPFGTTFLVQDNFEAVNEFNGGQVGMAGEWRRGRWYLGSRSLIAFGNTHSEVTINGVTRVTVPGLLPVPNSGGLLAQPTNIGRSARNNFSVVPESTLLLGYQLTDSLRAFVGYSVLYWTKVLRAGDQIDLVVNASQIPPGTLVGPARPAIPANTTDFWAQGVSFGVEMHY
jgi:hypothetical protein